MNSHRWWCDGQHDEPVYYRTAICKAPRETFFNAIAMPVASKADLDAAAMLLGYHPTHILGNYGTMFCDKCATNMTTPLAMEPCPKSLVGQRVGKMEPAGGPRHWSIAGSNGKVWDVEERYAKDGHRYFYCPCPSWKFGGQTCKHTIAAAQEM